MSSDLVYYQRNILDTFTISRLFIVDANTGVKELSLDSIVVFSSVCLVGILKDIIKKEDAAIGLLYSTPLDVWSIIGPS